MRGILRRVLVGVSVSVIILAVISVFSGVGLDDLAKVSLQAFVASSLLSLGSLLMRSIRFAFIVERYSGELGFLKAIPVRIASEFVALLSFAYVGDEAFRFGWLARKGVEPGKAAWMSYIEIFFDVSVGTILSLAAAVYLLLHNALILGIIVAAISATVLLGHILLILYSVRRGLRVPRILSDLVVRLLGERGSGIIGRVNEALEEFSRVSRSIMESGSRRVVAAGLGFTAMSAILWAASLQAALSSAGLPTTLYEALMISYAAVALSTIPVTIGGSGLSELGAALSAMAVYGDAPWPAVVAWRIASYHVPLVVSGVFLVWAVWEMGSGAVEHPLEGEEPS